MINISIKGDFQQKVLEKAVRFAAASTTIPIAVEVTAHEIGPAVVNALHNEAPVKTGTLQDSFNYDLDQIGESEIEITFNSEVDYSRYVQRGHVTRSGSFVEPDDYQGRALEAATPEIEAALNAAGTAILNELK